MNHRLSWFVPSAQSRLNFGMLLFAIVPKIKFGPGTTFAGVFGPSNRS